MAEVRRAQDELGQEPGQRRGLEAHRPPLAVDGGPGDPATTPREVEDVSPGFAWLSIRVAISAGGGGGASRSKNGSVNPGSARTRVARPAIRKAYRRPSRSPPPPRRRHVTALAHCDDAFVVAPAVRGKAPARTGASALEVRERGPQAATRSSGRQAQQPLGLVRLVELFFEGLVCCGLRRQDAIEVLDLLVLLVVLEVVLELHLLADQGSLRVRPKIG